MNRITDVIPLEDVKSWKEGDIVTISAPTGSGKSYFIKNVVYEVAKEKEQKILFLVHRSRCKEQFYNELKRDNKLDTIDIVTYQTLENKEFNFNRYKYIVCDEFHYFTGDSDFNYKTDISFGKILKQTDKIRILMSATGNLMKAYIKNVRKIETKDYSIEEDYSWINLTFFEEENSMNKILKCISDKGEKALVFIDDKNNCKDLYLRNEDKSLFCCSESQPKRYTRYINKDKIKNMLHNERFEENFLITTNVLDSGINLRDNKITTIICSIRDIDVLIQCLGRKRRREGEKVNVYIQNISNNVLAPKKRDISKKLDMCRDFREMDIKDWTNKYSRKDIKGYGSLIYDDGNEKKINIIMELKLKQELMHLEFIMVGTKVTKGIGYKQLVANILDHSSSYSEYEKGIKDKELIKYLNSITGKKLFDKEDKENLISKVDVRDEKRRVKTGIKSISNYLEENFNKIVISDRQTIKGKKLTYWIVKDKQQKWTNNWKRVYKSNSKKVSISPVVIKAKK